MDRKAFYMSKKENFIKYLKENNTNKKFAMLIEKYENMNYEDLVKYSCMYLKVSDAAKLSVYENYLHKLEDEYNITVTDEQKQKIFRYFECFSTI